MPAYGEIPSPISNADLKSSSSYFLNIQMDVTSSLIDKEVFRYNHIIVNKIYISKLRSNTLVSSTGNEEDVILEPYLAGEKVCTFSS